MKLETEHVDDKNVKSQRTVN